MPVWLALVPIIVLVVMLALVIKVFGSDAIGGGSQVALLVTSSIGALIAIVVCRCKWSKLEDAIVENIRTSASAIIVLLLIGAISGTWMLSGVVPTLMYYGLQIIHPSIFLAVACLICAVVAIVTGSSWTTIATIGVALMGVGEAQGYSEGWIAGAIISGAYFGDKVSALSDTTVLASSTVRVPLFEHIKYMSITTIPSFVIALVVFLVVSLTHSTEASVQMEELANTLYNSFNISGWLLLVPALTLVLIAKRLPALVTLFLSVVMACVAMVIAQPDIVRAIGGEGDFSTFRALMTVCSTSTSIDTGNSTINELVTTSGMQGMLNTIWLILCAMCFGGVMAGSGMLSALTQLFAKFVYRTASIVASTLTTGLLANLLTADQYISIIITGETFRELYKKRGLEARLLSRSIEDTATVTSVLVPWNSCGMTQSTVLGVATLTYLPYCLFNLISPLMSLLFAIIGYKIK
uniref:Na+/H+ antiporter NhaC n=1 Tax=Alistipes sp. TaxID=1872444 RepID=UPI004056AC03